MRQIKIITLCFSLLFVGLGTLWADPLVKPDRDILKERITAIYTSQIGVREATGHNDGVMVEKYLATTGFKKGNAWCAAFVTWTLDSTANITGVKIISPHSAWAPSWFTKNVIYTKGKASNLKPSRADVFGIYFAKDNRIGHVGFIDQWPPHDDYVITVEGNTNTAGSREGDGVYRKRRLKENIYKVSRWV